MLKKRSRLDGRLFWLPVWLVLFAIHVGAETQIYNSSHRLSSATNPAGSQVSYTYDPAGNITAMAVTPAGTTPLLTSDPAPWGRVGVAFSHALTSSRTPATFTATGLPPGLTLNGSTGVISGSPTTVGTYAVSATATSGGIPGTAGLTVQIRPAVAAPVILREPLGQTITQGQQAALFVDVDGTPPLAFQWRKNGTPISGATGMSLVIPVFAAADAGTYSVVVTNAAGADTSTDARMDTSQPWAISGESYGLPLTFTGTPTWFSQTTVTYDGRPAMQSGAVGHSQNTSFSATITGPGILQWRWKVSSQFNFDGLIFVVNGTQIQNVSGEQDWIQQTYQLNAGSNTVAWYYSKNASVNTGLDRGWVADVNFTPGWSLLATPSGTGSVTRNPDQTAYAAGTSVTLQATPGSGYYFAGWSGGASGTANPLTVVASAHSVMTALFKPDLGPALGAPTLTWLTGGNADWRSQFYVTQNDGIGAQAGTITHGQSSWVETTVTGPGTLTYWWRVSSQLNGDGMVLTVNGTSTDSASGEVDWVQRTLTLGSGAQTLVWSYVKNGGVSSGQDTAWLDAVNFTPTGPRTFALWAGDQGLSAGLNGMGDDPNHDGVPNLLAFAFGIHPMQQAAAGGMPVLSRTGGNVVLTYRKSKIAAGITWIPQTSTSLQQDWTAAGVTLTKISENADVEVWTAAVPAVGSPRRFLRILVSVP